MLIKYNIINSAFDESKQQDADLPAFSEFIKESFYKIKEKLNCSNVSFTVKLNNGRAEISALPETY